MLKAWEGYRENVSRDLREKDTGSIWEEDEKGPRGEPAFAEGPRSSDVGGGGCLEKR